MKDEDKMRSAILFAAFAITAAQLAVGRPLQQQQQTRSTAAREADDETIVIDAALVNTRVSVRDANGRLISGLTKDDFTVLDDDKEQPVVYFSEESNQPLRLAVVVDRSRSVEKMLTLARSASRDFFSSVLRPGLDSACVVAFDSHVYLARDYTDDSNVLADSLSGLSAAGGTSLFDAVYKAARDKLSGSDQARRLSLLITDGEDTTSRASLDQA